MAHDPSRRIVYRGCFALAAVICMLLAGLVLARGAHADVSSRAGDTSVVNAENAKSGGGSSEEGSGEGVGEAGRSTQAPAKQATHEQAAGEASEEHPAEEPRHEQPAEEPPKEQPAEEAGKEAPAEEPPAEEPPAEETAKEPPAEEPPAEETAKEPPAEEPPAEETAKEPPAEEPPAEEAPKEQPAEEAPANEAPAEEAPAAETSGEGSAGTKASSEEAPQVALLDSSAERGDQESTEQEEQEASGSVSLDAHPADVHAVADETATELSSAQIITPIEASTIEGPSAEVVVPVREREASANPRSSSGITWRTAALSCELSALGGRSTDNCTAGWLGAQRFLSALPFGLVAVVAAPPGAITSESPAGARRVHPAEESPPVSPAPSPTPGGASGSMMGASGSAFSTVGTIAGPLHLGVPCATRLLPPTCQPWRTARFVLIPERPD